MTRDSANARALREVVDAWQLAIRLEGVDALARSLGRVRAVGLVERVELDEHGNGRFIVITHTRPP